MLIYNGIFLQAVRNEDELAFVLAHEIAHVLANHDREDKSTTTVASICSLPFIPFALLSFIVQEAIIFVLPIAGIMWARFALSRKQEAEADYIGMMLMADAGYDPSATVNVLKILKQMEDQMLKADPGAVQDPQWMSTHPHVSRACSCFAGRLRADRSTLQSASRIRQIEAWIPEVLGILGKEPSNEVAVPPRYLADKIRRWKEYVKRRNESQSINREK